MNMMLGIFFGIAALACLFLSGTWLRIALKKPFDFKRFIVTSGWCLVTVGLGVLSANRASEYVFSSTLDRPMVLTAAVIIVAGMLALISATAMDNSKRTFWCFVATSAVWTIYCIWRFSS